MKNEHELFRRAPITSVLHGWTVAATTRGPAVDCSLVIATYQRPKETIALLATLALLPDPPMEVVVVDGSPDESTHDAIMEWSGRVEFPFTLSHVKSPRGLTRQRNVGIDASTREIIFFLDDDCLPQAGFFRTLYDVFARDTPRAVGAVCGSLVGEMDVPLALKWKLRFALGLVPRGEPGTYYPTATSVPRSLAGRFSGTRPVDMIPGGVSAFRREVFARYRFSLFFDGYSQGEDLDMSMRVGREWRLFWCGDALVIHNHATGGRPASFKKGVMEVRNRFFIRTRHSRSIMISDRMRFWLDIGFLALYDIGWYVSRPLQPSFLAHAAGVVYGAASCFVSPPRYEEPVAYHKYEFTWNSRKNKPSTHSFVGTP